MGKGWIETKEAGLLNVDSIAMLFKRKVNGKCTMVARLKCGKEVNVINFNEKDCCGVNPNYCVGEAILRGVKKDLDIVAAF